MPTHTCEIPSSAASNRDDQCVTPEEELRRLRLSEKVIAARSAYAAMSAVSWAYQPGGDAIHQPRVRFDRGARWSKDLKPYAGTDSCELPHVAMVRSGRLHVVMDDGSEEEFGPNEVMLLPPGHDAWTIGDQVCTFVEFSRGNDYYSA